MALSNWDLLAIDKKGKSCNGVIKNKIASLTIYKNWAYIDSTKMWNDGTGFVKPVIAQINNGNLHIAGLNITAIRHSLQNSIFVFVDASTYDKNSKCNSNLFAGIGCYGYYSRIDEYLRWKGIKLKYADYTTGSRNYKIGENEEIILLNKFIDIISLFDEKDNLLAEYEVDTKFGELTDFVGIMPETFKAFKNWITIEIVEEYKYNKYFEKWLESINWNELMRFNQGDTFFTNVDNVSTLVGKQEKDTLLMKLLK